MRDHTPQTGNAPREIPIYAETSRKARVFPLAHTANKAERRFRPGGGRCLEPLSSARPRLVQSSAWRNGDGALHCRNQFVRAKWFGQKDTVNAVEDTGLNASRHIKVGSRGRSLRNCRASSGPLISGMRTSVRSKSISSECAANTARAFLG